MADCLPYYARPFGSLGLVLMCWCVLNTSGCTTTEGTNGQLSRNQERFVKETKSLLVEIERVRRAPAWRNITLHASVGPACPLTGHVGLFAQPMPVNQRICSQEPTPAERDLYAIYLDLARQSRILEQSRQVLLAQWLALAAQEGLAIAYEAPRAGERRPVFATRKGFYTMVVSFLNRYHLDDSGLLSFESY